MNSHAWQRRLFLAEALIAVATSFMGFSEPEAKIETAASDAQVVQAGSLPRQASGIETKQPDSKPDQSTENKANQN